MARNFTTGKEAKFVDPRQAYEDLQRGNTAEGRPSVPVASANGARVHIPPLKVDARPRDGKQIRIVQKGWEKYTGNFGSHEFVAGVSVDKLTEVYQDRVATQLHCVDVETGDQIGPAYRVIQSRKQREAAPILTPMKGPEADVRLADVAKDVAAKAAAIAAKRYYTVKELEAVVDEKGILGLRDIGAEFNVKARAIPDLIANILKAQEAELGRGILG